MLNRKYYQEGGEAEESNVPGITKTWDYNRIMAAIEADQQASELTALQKAFDAWDEDQKAKTSAAMQERSNYTGLGGKAGAGILGFAASKLNPFSSSPAPTRVGGSPIFDPASGEALQGASPSLWQAAGESLFPAIAGGVGSYGGRELGKWAHGQFGAQQIPEDISREAFMAQYGGPDPTKSGRWHKADKRAFDQGVDIDLNILEDAIDLAEDEEDMINILGSVTDAFTVGELASNEDWLANLFS